ncbi:MAG: ABC transporter permease [Saprospiraceae bacterium]|nr:ABC transporter permease [Saprospiraceae bacterium]
MQQNYLSLAFRNLRKNRKYTLINLIGMSVGMACCFLIIAYLRYERHFDTFFPKGERLYRVNYHIDFAGEPLDINRVPAPIGPAMPDYFPQVESVARLYGRSISVREPQSDRQFEVSETYFADSTVQDVLGFDFMHGDPKTALDAPFSMVLSDETALRLFGTAEAMGRQLRVANEATFTVTGIVRRMPRQSHLRVDMLMPFRNIPDVEPASARPNVRNAMTNNWLASYNFTYVTLKPGMSPEPVNAAFPAFIKKFGIPEYSEKQFFSLFPVRDIHLHSAIADEVSATSNPQYLRVFGIVGFLILLIAVINFVNLSTAVYLDRTKEVAVRKALGARRPALVGQFLTETMLLSFMAFVPAMGLLFALIPLFNAQNDKFITYHLLHDWPQTLLYVGIFVVTGLLAGIYPAAFASRFKPVEVFQKNSPVGAGRQGQLLRKSLITIQFAVSIALLCGTLIMLSQMRYWQNLPKGFDAEQIITVPLSSANMNTVFSPGDSTLRSRMNAFDDLLMQNSGIGEVTIASSMPGFSAPFFPVTTSKVRAEDNVFLASISVDYDFAETFRLKMLAGRDFDKSFGSDHINSFILNEMALKTLGWASADEAIGQEIKSGAKKGKVIGVVNNFNTSGLQSALNPVILDVSPGSFTAFAIRLKTRQTQAVIADIERAWREFFPEKAFDYSFLNEDLRDFYEQEGRMMQLCADFAGITIVLACFGLFGLVDFTVRQRRKEIGVRKVLGASVPSVVRLLSKEFLQLVAIALLIASPIAWWAMEKWLTDFAYRIAIPWYLFVVAGALAALVAFLTVAGQTVRAAVANPVKALRSE